MMAETGGNSICNTSWQRFQVFIFHCKDGDDGWKRWQQSSCLDWDIIHYSSLRSTYLSGLDMIRDADLLTFESTFYLTLSSDLSEKIINWCEHRHTWCPRLSYEADTYVEYNSICNTSWQRLQVFIFHRKEWDNGWNRWQQASCQDKSLRSTL